MTTITVGTDRISFNVTSDQSDGEVAVLQVMIPPGGGPPMLHRHDPFELYRVCRGELAIYLAGWDGRVRRTLARAGDVVPIPGGREHTVRNESEHEADALVVFSPGEQMERFARAAGELSSHSPADVMTLAEAHGIQITRSIEEAMAPRPRTASSS